MKVGLLTFEKFHRKPFNSIGSSRIRMNTLARYWEDAEVFTYGRKYDVVIYQKAYWIDHAKAFTGKKILDLCDPDFMHWGYKTVEMIKYCDAITTSTQALALELAKYTDKPVWVIPDRVDLNDYPYPKEHSEQTTTIGWYGYSQNYHVINESGIIKAIYDLNKSGRDLEFIVISDGIYQTPAFAKEFVNVINYKWTNKTVNSDIQKCDIIVNPRLNSANWRFKSNNKTLNAWALGVPVARDLKELLYLMKPENRVAEIAKRKKELADAWDIRASVEEYQNLLKEI
jgi:hypothetical protein